MRLLRSISLTAFVLVGVLAASAAWHLWQTNREPSPRRAEPIAVRHQAFGVAAGVAVVVALLPVLQRLWFALIRHGSFGEVAGARRAMLGMVLVGSVLAALIVVSEHLLLLVVSAGAALTLFVVVHPGFGIMPYDGLTEFVFRFGLFLPPDIALIAGLLVAVGLWRLLETRRGAKPYRVFGVGGERGEGLSNSARSPGPAGAIGGDRGAPDTLVLRPKGGAVSETKVGTVTHWYGDINVAGIDLEGDLEVGDTIHIVGNTSDFTQTVESMQVDHEDVDKAGAGDSIGIKVTEHARENDEVFKV